MTEQLPQCIICLRNHEQTTIEHIVPRSLGNIHYILRKGKVCRSCNNRFARYESAVLTSERWLKKRQSYGVAKSELIPHRVEPDPLDLKRFLLKVCYESIYQSKPRLLKQYDFEPIREELATGKEANCDLVMDKGLKDTKNVAGIIDRWRLGSNHIYLKYNDLDERIYFMLRYGQLSNVLVLHF